MEVIRRLLGRKDRYQTGYLVGKTADGRWLVRADGQTHLVEPVSDETVQDGAQVVIKDKIGLGARK